MENYGTNNLKNTQLWIDIQNEIHNVTLQEAYIGSLNSNEDGGINQTPGLFDKERRDCKIGWIDNHLIMSPLYDKMCEYNEKHSNWNFDLKGLEQLQYTVYNNCGSHYTWHKDVHPWTSDYTFYAFGSSSTYKEKNLIRKISFTIFLNDPDEYEGGELDLEWRSPSSTIERYDTFKSPAGSIIVFPSSTWHRVRPVTSGIRKSLVGWVLGPPFR